MIRKLIALSLIGLPLYEVILYMLIPGRSYPEFPDMRVTKDFVCLAVSLVIGLYVLYSQGFKRFKEPAILAFLVFFVWNMYKIPQTGAMFLGQDINGFWNYFPVIKVLCLFLMFQGLINTKLNYDVIFRSISIAGLFMALYMIMQSLGWDQIFIAYPDYVDVGGKTLTINGATKNPHIGGLLGQATLSSPFVVMALPFMYEKLGALVAICGVLAVILSGSSFAMLSMVICALIYFIFMTEGYLKGGAIVLACALPFVAVFIAMKFPDLLNDNGRFEIWSRTLQDLKSRIALTGAGLGAYKYLFAIKNGNTWYQAHNEYLQLLWSCGVIGFTFIAVFVKSMFSKIIKSYSRDSKVIGISLLSVFLCGLGTFVFQLSAIQFYVIVLIAMVYQLNNEVGYESERY